MSKFYEHNNFWPSKLGLCERVCSTAPPPSGDYRYHTIQDSVKVHTITRETTLKITAQVMWACHVTRSWSGFPIEGQEYAISTTEWRETMRKVRHLYFLFVRFYSISDNIYFLCYYVVCDWYRMLLFSLTLKSNILTLKSNMSDILMFLKGMFEKLTRKWSFLATSLGTRKRFSQSKVC